MLRFAIAVLSLAVILACWREPAAANITDASLTTATPSHNGPCPATVNFSGTISGTPGTSFVLTWNRFINGKQTLVNANNGQPITLWGSSLTVSDSMQVTSNADNNNGNRTFDQIWLHNISPPQKDKYSTGAQETPTYFSVTCWKLNPNVVNQAPPTPRPKFGGSAIYQAYHDVPHGITQTTSGQECGSHAGGFACGAAFSNGWLVLVWCYAKDCGATSSATAQYFRIYEVDKGQHALVDQVQNFGDGTIATVGVVETPNGGFANQCYLVVAVDGKSEYGNNTVCLGNGTVGPFTTALHPSIATSHGQSSQYGNVPFRAACGTGSICVGWQHDQSSIIAPNIIPIWWYADNYRAYYMFDLSSVAGKYLISATLKIPIDSGDAGCFSGIAQANQDWTGNSNWVGGDFYNPGGSLNNGMDVTSIVRSWMNGNANYGFVLRGTNENLSAESTSCRTFLDSNAELDIVHS